MCWQQIKGFVSWSIMLIFQRLMLLETAILSVSLHHTLCSFVNSNNKCHMMSCPLKQTASQKPRCLQTQECHWTSLNGYLTEFWDQPIGNKDTHSLWVSLEEPNHPIPLSGLLTDLMELESPLCGSVESVCRAILWFCCWGWWAVVWQGSCTQVTCCHCLLSHIVLQPSSFCWFHKGHTWSQEASGCSFVQMLDWVTTSPSNSGGLTQLLLLPFLADAVSIW